MRNVLRKDAMSQVWNGTSKINENNNGGVALWTTPPDFHNAFNPAIFTRVKYLHQVEGYEPKFKVLPNYVMAVGGNMIGLKFSHKTTSNLYVDCTLDTGKKTVMVYAGSEAWRMSEYGKEILSIDSIGLSLDKMTEGSVRDSSCIYIRQGQPYEGDMYICKDENNVIYRNDEVETCGFTVYLQGGEHVTLYAESFKGKVLFNASEVIKKSFRQDLSQFDDKKIIRDKALYASYSIKGIGGTGTSYRFVAINAVSQIGYDYDRSADGGKVLTRMPAVKMYEGYPLDYSVLSTTEEIKTAGGIAPAFAVSRVLVGKANEKILLNEEAYPVLTEEEDEIVLMNALDIRVFRECIPQRPFYIRWINDLGGVDYFMFARQQKHQPQVKSVSVFSPFVENTGVAKSNLKAYAMNTDNTVVVGCSGLGKREFDALKRMPFSSLIEWYNEDIGKWIRLAVSKFDGSYFSKTETKGVEVTFSLPNINTQF